MKEVVQICNVVDDVKYETITKASQVFQVWLNVYLEETKSGKTGTLKQTYQGSSQRVKLYDMEHGSFLIHTAVYADGYMMQKLQRIDGSQNAKKCFEACKEEANKLYQSLQEQT